MDTKLNKNVSEVDVRPYVENKEATSGEKNIVSELNNDVEKRIIKFNPNDTSYDMSGDKYLVIFNHYKYDPQSLSYYRDPPKNRIGTDEDVKALKKTFGKLGFIIEIHDDLDRESIWEVFLQLRRKDLSSASCFCIAILTHGSFKDELYAYDAPYNLKDVTKLFETHPTLAGKPKVFFIQACRGNKADDGNRISVDGDDRRFIIAPSHADFLIVRSTVEDYMSYRDNRGSWLIQELCKAIRKHHETFDILHIMTLVNQKIALGYSTYSPRNAKIHNKRQNPETTFTLTKILKFPSVTNRISSQANFVELKKIKIDEDKTIDQSKPSGSAELSNSIKENKNSGVDLWQCSIN